MVKRYFADETEMAEVIEPFLKLFEQSLREGGGSAEARTTLSVGGWHDLFDTMANFYPLVRLLERDDLEDRFGSLLRHSLLALDAQLQGLGSGERHSQQFKTSDFIGITQKVLDLKGQSSELSAIYESNENILERVTNQIFRTHILSGLIEKQQRKGMSGGDHAQMLMSQRTPGWRSDLRFIREHQSRAVLQVLIAKSNSSLIYKEIGGLLSCAKELTRRRDGGHAEGFVYLPKSKIVQLLQDIPNVRSIQGQDLERLFEIVDDLLANPTNESSGPDATGGDTQQLLQRALHNQGARTRIIRDCRRVLMLAASNL